ncbi:hypothetical protein XBO1_2090002 [Xenorhabdus bovienii str. oregonense]|uniref:Uncharacterized protein n=1 Tax=Xenorhabdus bovienii str. oregonense TaxID=1398202 RepID=A0A077P5R5_XENBV|nr:hypothetical protein XBO1_2090002 [Xenorhabdus bovienii str. oregonense]
MRYFPILNGDHPRYRCYTCGKVFQLEYTYQACKPGVKEQIVESTWALVCWRTLLETNNSACF